MTRQLTYAEAINEALDQAMALDENVTVMGQLVDYAPGVFGTTRGLREKYGARRVFDFPVAESLMTTSALGACLVGVRPVIVHQRLDFMMYSLDAIVNWMSLWFFKSNGQSTVPVTIRAIVGKGWGQAAQHSKSLHAWFAHLPGVQVAIPATAHDAKGLLLESIFGETPTIMIENRSLFSQKDTVPLVSYRVRMGKAKIRRRGRDVSLVAIGALVPAALRVADALAKRRIEADVIDLRTLTPLDRKTLRRSVMKTGRVVVMDAGWQSFGAAAEIIADIAENCPGSLKAAPRRLCLPDSHTPMSHVLENQYYHNEAQITEIVLSLFSSSPASQ